jgi:hypothetical protein
MNGTQTHQEQSSEAEFNSLAMRLADGHDADLREVNRVLRETGLTATHLADQIAHYQKTST